MGLNLVGSLGDPDKIAAALGPLIDGAEDKALAEIHATAILVTTALHQEVVATREALIAELQEWRKMVAPTIKTGQETIGDLQPLIARVQEMVGRVMGVQG